MYHLLMVALFFQTTHLGESSNAVFNTLTERCDQYSTSGFYDKDLGRVSINTWTYCSPVTLRIVPGYTCCTPEPPTSSSHFHSSNFPNFFFFPPTNESSPPTPQWLNWRAEEPAKQLLSSYSRIIYLVHGWSENLWTSVWLNRTIKAWTLNRSTPVIVVDWSAKNKKFSQTAANTVTVGSATGFSLFKWNVLDRSEMVGHSAGAQVVAEVGNYVKKQGSTLKRCVVLDPAGPGFDNGDATIRISRDDCEIVEAIHSSSPHFPFVGPLVGKYGTVHKVGACDYYLNCGNRQPSDCQDPKTRHSRTTPSITSFCSHHLAPVIYAEQVANNCSFSATSCPYCAGPRIMDACSYGDVEITKIPPDSDCKRGDDVAFHVKTNAKFPYC